MQCLSNSTGLESIVSLSLFQNTSPGAPHPTLHAETQLLAPPWRIRVLEGRVREERALSEWVRLPLKQQGSGWSPDFLQFFPGISNERSWRLPTWSSRLSFSQRSQAFHGSSHPRIEDRGPSPLGDNGSASSARAREVVSPWQTPAGEGSTVCFVGWHSPTGNNRGSQGTQWDTVVFPTEGFSCLFCIVRQFDMRVILKRDKRKLLSKPSCRLLPCGASARESHSLSEWPGSYWAGCPLVTRCS